MIIIIFSSAQDHTPGFASWWQSSKSLIRWVARQISGLGTLFEAALMTCRNLRLDNETCWIHSVGISWNNVYIHKNDKIKEGCKSCELNLCWCMKLKKKLRNRCQKTTGADWEAIFCRRRHFWHAPCWTPLFQRVSSPLSAHFQWCWKKIAAEKPDSKGGQNSGKSGAITSCWKTIMHTWVPAIAVTSLSPLDILAESNSNENMVWFWTFMSKISVTGLRL